MNKLLTVFVTISLLMLLSPLSADDSGGGSSGERTERVDTKTIMKEARALIADMKYKKAIRTLNAVIRADGRDADAWNLIGYSNRKMGKYKKAGKAYRRALKYNPQHKGALEYQGELFIILKQYDKAKANRDRLAALCPEGCEQLADLDEALGALN